MVWVIKKHLFLFICDSTDYKMYLITNVWFVIEYEFYEQVINKIQCVINTYRTQYKLKM